jgi:glycosyltransferase involved in cell wall biosynthesis
MPNAVLEALAMGMPIVSSDAGGLKDILRNGENGFIVPPLEGAVARKKFDPKVVADAIERLVENRESYERVATVNWRYARQRFAAPFVAKRLEEIYRSLSNERKVFSEVNSKNEIPVFPK